MSNPIGCNQHLHQPGCWHPEAPHNRRAGTSISPWGMYVPAGMDDGMTAASEHATHEIYVRITQLDHTPAQLPSEDDKDVVDRLPYPEKRQGEVAIATQTRMMEKRRRTPPPHPVTFSPDEVQEARREVLRERLAYEESIRREEVDIDLMAMT